MTLLTRDRERLKLTELGLEEREWTVWEVDDIPTGDGAVMLWGSSAATGADCVSVVTFPLSPTQLLLIRRRAARGCALQDAARDELPALDRRQEGHAELQAGRRHRR